MQELDDHKNGERPAKEDEVFASNFFNMGLCLFSGRFAEDTGGADEQNDNQDGEGDRIAHGGGDIGCAEHFGLAHDQRANQAPGMLPIPPRTAATKAFKPG